MIETGTQNISSFHLAGIVPIAGQKLNFNMPWHDSLMPIAQDYLAVERAVLECAWAGCETIWVVCHRDVQCLVKERLGEWIQDPVQLLQDRFYQSNIHRRIPIYYVPIHPKDRDRRDCLSWSALYGALSAYHISNRLSKWVIPDKFYCAFPYGVYDPSQIREQRKKISSKAPFYLTHKGQSVKTGEYLGFTFDGEDFKTCRRELRVAGTPSRDPVTNKRIPVEERWSARFFSVDKVFQYVIFGEDEGCEINGYSRIDNWDDYVKFMSFGEKHQKPDFFKPKKWNKIGERAYE